MLYYTYLFCCDPVMGIQMQKAGVWAERQLFLTRRELGFSLIGGTFLQDFIQLLQIETIKVFDESRGQLLEGSINVFDESRGQLLEGMSAENRLVVHEEGVFRNALAA